MPRDSQTLAGTGLGLLHAYDGATGHDVAGFPKVTGGWLFSPAALSDDGRIADITREGYLFQWRVSAPACQTQWPMFRHDPEDSANYNMDGVPPAAVEHLGLRSVAGDRFRLTFVAPGDNVIGTNNASIKLWVLSYIRPSFRLHSGFPVTVAVGGFGDPVSTDMATVAVAATAIRMVDGGPSLRISAPRSGQHRCPRRRGI